MNTFNESNVAQQAHDFANKAADKAKDGIDNVAATLSAKVDAARQRSETVVDQVNAAASKVRDSATAASDSIVTYTRNHPVKALMMAAVTGALFLAVIEALTPSRD